MNIHTCATVLVLVLCGCKTGKEQPASGQPDVPDTFEQLETGNQQDENSPDGMTPDYTLDSTATAVLDWQRNNEPNAEYRKKYFNRDTVVFLEPGLWYHEFVMDTRSGYSIDYPVVALKIDPAFFNFRLVVGREVRKDLLAGWSGSWAAYKAGDWADTLRLIAATNLGMFDPEGVPTGYLAYEGKIMRSKKPAGYQHFFTINSSGEPGVYDTACDSIPPGLYYATSLIRMRRCDGATAWSKQPENQWSTACLAMDHDGFVYFIHSRSALTVYDLTVEIMKKFPRTRTISYLEGGPEASLSIHSGSFRRDLCGSFETGFVMNDGETEQWELPNVIGISRKQK